MQIEGSGGLDVPYLGYVETHLRIPKIKAFDNDILLLIVPDSMHTHHTPITLGRLNIDMVIGQPWYSCIQDRECCRGQD